MAGMMKRSGPKIIRQIRESKSPRTEQVWLFSFIHCSIKITTNMAVMDKIQSLCTEVNQRTEDASQSGAGYPVNVIIQGYKKHEPASIHIFRDFCGIVYGKTFIAHTEDQIEFFQTGSLVFFQPGNTVKKMTGVNHQSHGQCLNRMEGAQKKIYGNKFNESGKNCQAHEHGIPEAES